MASSSTGAGGPANSPVQVVVVGDSQVGKTSLIAAATSESFPAHPAPRMPPIRVPGDATPEGVPMVVTDTSAAHEDHDALEAAIQLAHVLVVCFAEDRPETLERVHSHWLPRLAALAPSVPVIVVGCRADVTPLRRDALSRALGSMTKEFGGVEALIECSAKKLQYVSEPFHYALKAVRYPMSPLYDHRASKLRPAAAKALKRVFMLCDLDGDGALDDGELNAFQVRCFNAPLKQDELNQIKAVVREAVPDGVNSAGLTLAGFLFLHALFIERGRHETTWNVLHRFGYSADLALDAEITAPVAPYPNGESVTELSTVALDFLRAKFLAADRHGDDGLCDAELEELFSAAPLPPTSLPAWAQIRTAANPRGDISMAGFIAKWAAWALDDPAAVVEHLLYIGYQDETFLMEPDARAGATAATRLLSVLPRAAPPPPPPKASSKAPAGAPATPSQPARRVLACAVIGAAGTGKDELVARLAGPYGSGGLSAATTTAAAAALQARAPGAKDDDPLAAAVLVLRKVPDDAPPETTSAALAAADVAAFVFDAHDPRSFAAAQASLISAADAVPTLPCVLIAAKAEVGMTAELESLVESSCASLQLPAPLRVSGSGAGAADAYARVAAAAWDPRPWRPMTPARAAAQARREALQRAALAAGGVAAVAALGVGLYALLSREGGIQGPGTRSPAATSAAVPSRR